MRSFIIIEVEHGEDTDEFTDLVEHLNAEVGRYSWCEAIDYSVAVDVPAHTPTPDEVAAILSL